jgi:hypothetical protein
MRLNPTTGKVALALTLAFLPLTLSPTAQAGNPSLCARDGWTTAQSSTGGAFASLPECAQAREVYQPSLSIDPDAVGALETTIVTGQGFHASDTGTLSIAVTGQDPYFSFPLVGNEDGSFIIIMRFTGCGFAPPYDLTLTLTDSFGVHASAQMTLC